MIDTALVIVKNVLTMSVATILVVALLWLLFQLFTLWYKWKDREKRSLDLTTLLVVVPEDNEVKVDADVVDVPEQLFVKIKRFSEIDS